jgi:hypothetical protein
MVAPQPAEPQPSRSHQYRLPLQTRVERVFAEWIETDDGRTVEAEVVHRARLLLASGIRRWGISSLWETIRYDRTIAIHGGAGYEWRLNNSYRSLLARRVMARYEDLRGFFEVRELRGRL